MLYPAELRGQDHARTGVATTAELDPAVFIVRTYLGSVEQKPVKVASVSGSVDDDLEDDEADLTRKQRREQARAQRKELEEAEAAGAARRTRLTRLGIVVAVVVAAIVVILVATGGGSKGGIVKKGDKAEGKVVNEVTSLLSGVPQNGNVLGDPKAPVTLVYYGDLECPICKEFTLSVLPSIVQQWVRTRQGEDRIPLAGDRHARTGNLQDPAGRRARGGQAEQDVALPRALLPRAGRRGYGLRHGKLPSGPGAAGAGAEPHAVDERPQRTRAGQPGRATTRRRPALWASPAPRRSSSARAGQRCTKFEPGTFTELGPYNAAIEKLLKS